MAKSNKNSHLRLLSELHDTSESPPKEFVKELTREPKVPQPAKVREEEKTTKRNARGADFLKKLDALVVPQEKPREILQLEDILANATSISPSERREFVDKVNIVVHRANYCFVLEPDDAVSRKLYLNADGSEGGAIEFQLTRGGLRGFLKTKYQLVPYSRPSR